MMKKLKLIICLTAVMLFSAQALLAQSSATLDVTNGRFTTDVDNFFSVNDWADLEFSKWFSYLKMENITLPTDWEAGFGLKTSKAYLGFYYSGTFNNGNQAGETVQTVYNTNASVTKTRPDISAGGFPGYGQIQHDNFYGVLIGAKDMGWQVTIDDQLSTVDLPQVQAVNQRIINGFTVLAGSEGSYRRRTGSITPAVGWGMAKDITLGKFTMRPSASFALEVAFNEEEFKLTDPNGEAYTDPALESFTNNHFTPTIGFDSGGSPLWSGDWGSVKLGVAEEFSFTIIGTGSSSPQNGTHGGLIYDNKISPYATFSFDVAQDLSLGAKLNVPLWFGGAPNAAAYDGYFGVGAKQVTTFTATPPTTAYTRNNENNLPTLGIGFQYVFTSNGLFRDAVDKLNLNEKLRLNWGILVFLPGYLYTSNYEYDDPAGGAITISDTRGHYWFQGDNNFLQILSAGFTFAITPAFIIDAGYNQNQFKVLLNVKY